MHIPGKFDWYQICNFRVLYFQVFWYQQKLSFYAAFGRFWLIQTPQNVVNFVWHFDQGWHARWWIKSATVFGKVLKNGPNCAKKPCLFAHFERFWVTSQNFAKWKSLLRYTFTISFISIAYAVLKVKIYKVFRINSVSMIWPLFWEVFGPLLLQMLLDLAEILTRGSLQ